MLRRRSATIESRRSSARSGNGGRAGSRRRRGRRAWCSPRWDGGGRSRRRPCVVARRGRGRCRRSMRSTKVDRGVERAELDVRRSTVWRSLSARSARTLGERTSTVGSNQSTPPGRPLKTTTLAPSKPDEVARAGVDRGHRERGDEHRADGEQEQQGPPREPAVAGRRPAWGCRSACRPVGARGTASVGRRRRTAAGAGGVSSRRRSSLHERDFALAVGPVGFERRSSSGSSGGSRPIDRRRRRSTVMLSRPPWRLAVATSVRRRPAGRRSGELLADRVVEHLVDQAVGAQQEAVAADQREGPGVDPHVGLDAEGAGDDVPVRVEAGFVGGDLAGGDELLDVAVVDAELLEHAGPEDVGP